MTLDIAIDNNGDLVFSANRDLATVTDIETVEQRIRMRLLLPLGTFSHDDEDMLGSDIYTALRFTEKDEQLFDDLALRIQEALAPMSDIQVIDVQMQVTDHRVLEIQVVYQMTPEVEEAGESIGDVETEAQILTLEIPTGEGEE
jgi:hypothetical protein